MPRRIEHAADTPPPVAPDDEAAQRILDGLNPEQQAAVEATDGPVMITIKLPDQHWQSYLYSLGVRPYCSRSLIKSEVRVWRPRPFK
jgi:hypothetical protein